MIKQFIPLTITPEFDRPYIQELFRRGELSQAHKLCKKHSQAIAEFTDDIAAGIRKLTASHRAGTALSFLFNNRQMLQAEPFELIKACFSHQDYHAFLKNCVRFKVKAGLATEIEVALDKIRQDEATAWRKKLAGFH